MNIGGGTKRMNIYQKLIEVRKSVPYLQKESTGAQYKYVGSSQVLASLKAKMDELQLLLIPRVTSHKVSESTIQYYSVDADKRETEHVTKRTTTYFTEIDMTMTWVNAENPEETIECPWYGQGVDIAGEKGVGKALTYAEKYFMLKFFNVPTDKDDPDSFQAKHDDKPVTKPELVRKQEQKPVVKEVNWVSFWNECKKLGYTMEEVQKIAGTKDFSKWTKEKASALFSDLKTKQLSATVGGTN
jgi:hypothetical protein